MLEINVRTIALIEELSLVELLEHLFWQVRAQVKIIID